MCTETPQAPSEGARNQASKQAWAFCLGRGELVLWSLHSPVGQGKECPLALGPLRPHPMWRLKVLMSHKSWKGSKSQIRGVWPLPGRDFKGSQLKGQVAPSVLRAGCASVSRPLLLGMPWFPGSSFSAPYYAWSSPVPPTSVLLHWRQAPGCRRTSRLSNKLKLSMVWKNGQRHLGLLAQEAWLSQPLIWICVFSRSLLTLPTGFFRLLKPYGFSAVHVACISHHICL